MFDSFFLQTEAPILQQEAPAPTQPHECNVKHEPKNGGQKPHHHHASREFKPNFTLLPPV